MALAALRGAIATAWCPASPWPKPILSVTAGLSRILGMQLDNGGFGYWPGQREGPSLGLDLCRHGPEPGPTNGLEVPEAALEKTTAYLREQISAEEPGPAPGLWGLYPVLYQIPGPRHLPGRQQDYPQTQPGGQNSGAAGGQTGQLYVLPRNSRTTSNPEPPKKPRTRPKMISRPATGPRPWPCWRPKLLPQDPFTEQAALTLLGGLDSKGVWTSTADTGWALLALGGIFPGTRTFGPHPWRSPSAARRPAASTSNWTPRAFAPWPWTPRPC